MTALLALEGVSKQYAGPPPVAALRDVDLRVEPGDFLAIVGPSGSGKSTLLHILGTLDRPTRGRVLVRGEDVSALPDRAVAAVRAREIGFVFQHFFLLDGMTARENVAQALLYRGVPRGEREAQATEALERVGLGHRLDHRPAELSGGERQRVAIARALVGKPAVVLADEPTGNLDSRNGVAVVDLLDELNGDGVTIAVITHDHAVADRMARRVEILDGVLR